LANGSKIAPAQTTGPDGYFHRLSEASQDCMWVLSPDGRVRSMNGRARALLGLAEAASATLVLADLWPEESHFSLERAVAAAAAGHAQKFRAFFRGPGGVGAYWETQISPVRDERGDVQELLAVSRDVTTAVETQAFLETVIQSLPAALSVKDARDGRFILINPAAEDLLNIGPDEGRGKTLQDLLPPDQAAALAAADLAALASGGLLNMEHRREGRDEGGPRYFAVKVLATHDDHGPRHLISIGDDITERTMASEALRAALQDAQQAVLAKSAFIANMSHELRTPLNGIVAGMDLLARGALSPQSRELVDVIRDSSEALHRLLSDLLDIAAADSGRTAVRAESFHVGEALRAAAQPFQLAAERKGLTWELDIAADLDAMAIGDAGRLRQVLASLLSNAVKFTDRGRIQLRASRPAPDIARFSIRDTGLGFDPARKALLFERFYQADPSYTRRFDGAGLGLAIAKEMVERMGGALDCHGRERRGATFWFELPLPAPDQGEAGPPPASAPAAGLRVLLADDHPTNRLVVEMMLAEVADIVSVENGAEAVAAFRDNRFDLVLMDMQMPVMDGLSAVRELRRLEAAKSVGRTPIVMLTANAGPEHRRASAQAGADHHLGKPITVDTLFATLETALAEPTDDARDPFRNLEVRAASSAAGRMDLS
jgi:PAS domain S-box-containing protein